MYSVFELVSEDILEAVGAAPNLKPPKSARAGPCGDETARDAVWRVCVLLSCGFLHWGSLW